MTKRFEKQIQEFKYNNQQLPFTLGTVVVLLICSFLIVIATFTQLSFINGFIPLSLVKLLSHFHLLSINIDSLNVSYYQYIPQVPIIMFISTILGKKYGVISVIIYIITGLFFFPVFALGGGFDYFSNYSFGYILAYIITSFTTGHYLQSKICLANILKATIIGVLIIHAIGISYLCLILVLKNQLIVQTVNWFELSNLHKIIYDLILSFFAIILGYFAKKILWLAIS